ncbi:MAG: hypothetical protein ACTS4Y_00820 [Candidatus Hodgkinia cicadicola]
MNVRVSPIQISITIDHEFVSVIDVINMRSDVLNCGIVRNSIGRSTIPAELIDQSSLN